MKEPLVNQIFAFSIKGRADRGAYWLGLLFYWFCAWAAQRMVPAFFLNAPATAALAFEILFSAIVFVLFVGFLTLVIRRLHDIGYSAAAALFILIPGINLLCLILLGLFRGKEGANRFGLDPVISPTPRDAPEIVDLETDHFDAQPEKQKAGQERAAIQSAVRANVASLNPLDDLMGKTQSLEDIVTMTRIVIKGESVSVALQIKVKAVGKLTKLLQQGMISEEDFQRAKREIMAL